MVDIFTAGKRSYVMSRVLSKDTKPEKIVRSFLHNHGFRFRLHVKSLPGTPDLVMPRYGVVVFVNGCFWHRHKDCARASHPQTRRKFWEEKFMKTVARDKSNYRQLRKLGWKVFVLWECALKGNEPRKLRKLKEDLIAIQESLPPAHEDGFDPVQ